METLARSHELHKNLHEDCERTYAQSRRRCPDVERRSRNPQTTCKYFWDNIWGHFTLTVFQLSARGEKKKWRIRYLCCSTAARVAYSADIGSKPGRFNKNGQWQAWQLNKNTLLTHQAFVSSISPPIFPQNFCTAESMIRMHQMNVTCTLAWRHLWEVMTRGF